LLGVDELFEAVAQGLRKRERGWDTVGAAHPRENACAPSTSTLLSCLHSLAVRPVQAQVIHGVGQGPPHEELGREVVDVLGAGGAATVDGMEMLVQQGAIAFKEWTGIDAPVDVMRAAAQAG
jgi:hypothetical protein